MRAVAINLFVSGACVAGSCVCSCVVFTTQSSTSLSLRRCSTHCNFKCVKFLLIVQIDGTSACGGGGRGGNVEHFASALQRRWLHEPTNIIYERIG